MNFTFTRTKTMFRATFVLASMGFGCSLLWAQQAPEKTQAPEVKRDVRWGEVDNSGLRLGIFRVEEDSATFCVLENAGEKPVTFNDYYLGYFEAISIQARLKGTEEWIRLPSAPFDRLYNSAGPSQINNFTLAPHQHHRGQHYYRVLNAPPPVISPSIRTLTPAEFKEIQAISELWKKRSSERSSFLIYAGDFNWPTNWSGTVEFKVQQEFPNFNVSNQWQGEIESGILEADAAKMVAERARLQTRYEQRQKEQEVKREQTKSKTKFP